MSIRKFALVVLDKSDKIIDRYNLDLVTNPTGLGFELQLSTIGGDVEDIITKVEQKKNQIKMTALQYNNSYSKANILSNWIQKYSTSDYKMCLEYNDTKMVKYCEGKITSFTRTELDEYRTLANDLVFTQTTPFFIKKEQEITIQVASVGKSYPYRYPYSYGRNEMKNNEIDNPYIVDVPIIITIDGAIDNPTVNLIDEDNNVYNTVKILQTIQQGDSLVINSAQKKIYLIHNGTETDYFPELDPQYDSFLRAKNGKSTISINTTSAGTGFKLTGGWRQYTL